MQAYGSQSSDTGYYSETVKIVELPKVRENDTNLSPHLHIDRLEQLLSGVLDHPVLVVSITGEFRSGKSFLLNLMTTYLDWRRLVSSFHVYSGASLGDA